MLLDVVNAPRGSFQWYVEELTTHPALKKIGPII